MAGALPTPACAQHYKRIIKEEIDTKNLLDFLKESRNVLIALLTVGLTPVVWPGPLKGEALLRKRLKHIFLKLRIC